MFIADAHGRDNPTLTATAGFDATGKLTRCRLKQRPTWRLLHNGWTLWPTSPADESSVLPTAFRSYTTRALCGTNTMPVAAYRGAGRPEACYVMERVMSAARQLGIDGVTLRKVVHQCRNALYLALWRGDQRW